MKFKNGDRAEIVNTGGVLDGKIVTVCGIAAVHGANLYHFIVKFDSAERMEIYDHDISEDSYQEWDAIQLTEHCLKRICGNCTTCKCKK